jgi:DNA-binding FadR family transcriptional regulator
MAKRNKEVTTVVGRVVRALREHALETPPGQLLGPEDQLVATYSVSRPTLRQAAALVAQEQLLVVKRGVGGGYFARRPSSEGVAHMAAIFLRSRQTTLEEIIKAVEPIRVEMTALAAANRDPEALAAWREFQAADAAQAEQGGYREFLRSEREYGRLLGAASQNRVLELFLMTLLDFCASILPEEDVYRDHPERVRAYWSRRQMALAAIIDGDADVAALTARRCTRMVVEWMVEDMGRAGKSADAVKQVWAFSASGHS